MDELDPQQPEIDQETDPSLAEQYYGTERFLGNMDNARFIPVDYVYPNPLALRDVPDNIELDELTSSIRQVGILEPLVAVQRGRRRFILIAGHRRLEAAKKAGLVNIPCVVLDISDDEFLSYSLIENLQRSDLTPLEEANAIKQLVEHSRLGLREVALKLGKSVGFISERMALYELPEDVREAYLNGTLTIKKALELARIPVVRIRQKLIERYSELPFEKFRELINETIANAGKRQKPRERWYIIPELREYAEQHESVKVTKDRISLRFESTDNLRDLLSELIAILTTIDADTDDRSEQNRVESTPDAVDRSSRPPSHISNQSQHSTSSASDHSQQVPFSVSDNSVNQPASESLSSDEYPSDDHSSDEYSPESDASDPEYR